MRITEGRLRLLVRETLLTESVREGRTYKVLIEKFPDLESAIGEIADHKKAGSALVKWLFSRFIEGSPPEVHPIEDAIVSIKKFARSFEKVESKWRSNPASKKGICKFFKMPEWENEISILDLIPRMTSDQIDKLPDLASREKQEIEINVSEEEMESDRVGKVGPWNLWMPTTRERSCAIAQYDPVTLEPKTTWCTARMAGSNLFYNYVGRTGSDMTLFYIIKDDPKGDQDWLSVGFINGKPSLEGKDGGISVDRANSGLTPGKLQSILSTYHDKIMALLTEKNKSLGGKHPAGQKILDAAQSIEAFRSIMKGLSKDEAQDMREIIAQEESISPDVLDELANTKTDNEYFLAYIAKNPKTPPQALARMAEERGQYIEEWVAQNPNTSPETLEMLSHRKEFYEYNVRYGVALNPNTPARALRTLARDELENIRALVASRKDGSVPDDVFDLLADDRDEGVLSAVAMNEKAPDYVLKRLAKSGILSVRGLVASNAGAPTKVLEDLAYDRDRDIKIKVAKNMSTPIKTLEMLAADIDDYLNMPARATLHRIREEQAKQDAEGQPISEALLRQIIREALEDEIEEAHAGGLGFAYEKGSEPESDESEPQDDDEWQRHVQDRARGAQRYARSSRFRKLAEKHYANLPFPVWTAPYIGNMDDISTVVDVERSCYRMNVMDLGTEGKKLLGSLGYRTEGVDDNDLVILYTTGVADSSVMATPWMIIHAIFDSAACANLLVPGYAHISDALAAGRGYSTGWGYDTRTFLKSMAGDPAVSWQGYLTMKSARDNNINSPSDAMAEMMCQELLTSRGLRLDLEGVDENDPIRRDLVWLAEQVKAKAAEFRKRARGKLIAIAVNQGDV